MIRVSRVMGRGDDLLSPELQRTAIEDYARSRDINVIDWVEALDESGSGRTSKWWARLDQVIARVEAHEVDTVLVWKFSRAARNRRRWAVAVDRIEVAGGQLESATEQLDTTTSVGRLGRGVLAEVNAFESEVKGEQWKEVHQNRVSRGLPHGGHPRFGYTYNAATKSYTPHETEGPVLAEVYRRWIAGAGWITIRDWLTDQGVMSERTGRPWTPSGIKRACDSGFAAGLLHFGGGLDRAGNRITETWATGAHEPLITADTWARYQRERRLRAGDQTRVQAKPSTAFSGLVKCGACGWSMRACKASKSTPGYAGQYYLYACTNKRNYCAEPAHVVISRVETEVLTWLRLHSKDVKQRAAVVAATRAKRITAEADNKDLNRQLLKVIERLETAARNHSRGLYDDLAYTAATKDLNAERGRLEAQLDKLRADLDQPKPDPVQIRDLLAGWERHSMETKRTTLRGLGVRIEVTRGPLGTRVRSIIQITGGWERP